MRGLSSSSSSSKQHDLTAPTAVLWAQQSIYRYLVRAQEQRLLQQLAQVRRSAAQALWGYGRDPWGLPGRSCLDLWGGGMWPTALFCVR